MGDMSFLSLSRSVFKKNLNLLELECDIMLSLLKNIKNNSKTIVLLLLTCKLKKRSQEIFSKITKNVWHICFIKKRNLVNKL